MHESMLHACAAVRAMAGTDLCYSCVLGFEIEKKNLQVPIPNACKTEISTYGILRYPGLTQTTSNLIEIIHRIVGRA